MPLKSVKGTFRTDRNMSDSYRLWAMLPQGVFRFVKKTKVNENRLGDTKRTGLHKKDWVTHKGMFRADRKRTTSHVAKKECSVLTKTGLSDVNCQPC